MRRFTHGGIFIFFVRLIFLSNLHLSLEEIEILDVEDIIKDVLTTTTEQAEEVTSLPEDKDDIHLTEELLKVDLTAATIGNIMISNPTGVKLKPYDCHSLYELLDVFHDLGMDVGLTEPLPASNNSTEESMLNELIQFFAQPKLKIYIIPKKDQVTGKYAKNTEMLDMKEATEIVVFLQDLSDRGYDMKYRPRTKEPFFRAYADVQSILEEK